MIYKFNIINYLKMDENEIIRLFNLAKQLLLNIDDNHPYVYEAESYYIKIMYNGNNIYRYIDLNSENIKILHQLLLNDIKLGYPYAIYYYNKYITNFSEFIFNFKINETIEYIWEGYNSSDIKNKKSILTVISNLGGIITKEFFFKLYEKNNVLESKIQDLERENSILKTHIEYMPDGPGYKEAEKHFLNNIIHKKN